MLAAIKSAFGFKDWPEYTRAEVAAHNTEDSVWLVAGDRVFDVTRFVQYHPAGAAAILKRAGGCEDCTMDYKFHSKGARQQWRDCQVGVLKGSEISAPIPANAAPDPAMIKRNEAPINYHGTFYATQVAAVAAAEATVKAADATAAYVAALAKVDPTAPQQPSASDLPAHETDENDGGEDLIAVGHCCRGGAPSDACKTCPNAPKCVRNGTCAGDCALGQRRQVGADSF